MMHSCTNSAASPRNIATSTQEKSNSQNLEHQLQQVHKKFLLTCRRRRRRRLQLRVFQTKSLKSRRLEIRDERESERERERSREEEKKQSIAEKPQCSKRELMNFPIFSLV
jgi:hypothetical protein